MKNAIITIKSALFLMVIFSVLFGGLYSFLVYGVGVLFFPEKSKGSLIHEEGSGKCIGSSLIGQNFSEDKYFHPRPSCAGKEGFDATLSGGSNLGPTSKELIQIVKNRVEFYRTKNSLSLDVVIPIDAVTASGSGLDPHISLRNAFLQVPRVAKARGMSEEKMFSFVLRHTEMPTYQVLGEARVNTVLLNYALDKEKALSIKE